MKKSRVAFYGLMAVLAVSGSTMLIRGLVIKHESHQAISRVQKINKQSVVLPSSTATSKATVSYSFDDVRALTTNLEQQGANDKSRVKRIGTLDIDAIKIHTPINEGISNSALALGAGTLKPAQTIGKGNYALAGHDAYGRKIDSWLFANLHLAQVGNIVKVTYQKNIAEYRVTDVRCVSIHDVDVIQDSEVNGRALITLLTCYSPHGHTSKTQRLMVRGAVIKTEKRSN